jgi:hypothetical protein
LHIHVKFCSRLIELATFLEKITPEELITVTEGSGYTVIWKSNDRYDNRH